MKTIIYSSPMDYGCTAREVLNVPDEMTEDTFGDLWGEFDKIDYRSYKEQLPERSEISIVSQDFFVDWLCKNHGCQRVASEEWCV